MARSALYQIYNEYENFVPLIWKTDFPESAGALERFAWYDSTEIPLAVFSGQTHYQHEPIDYTPYVNMYNDLIDEVSPLEIEMEFGMETDEERIQEFSVSATIEVTEEIVTTDNKVFFALTMHDDTNYSTLVIAKSDTVSLELYNIGEMITITQTFDYLEEWNIENVKAVVIVQSWENQKILQSGITGLTELFPLFATNIQNGPPVLGVHFNDDSHPEENITAWEWDFDNDGTIDSYEQNPYHLYEEPGVYDVSLTIYDENDSAYLFKEQLITVNDHSAVSGKASGIWTAEHSPYILDDDAFVAITDDLVIEPGTVISAGYNRRLTVYGQFQAIGTEEEPILFSAENQWKGIKLSNTTHNNIISYCEISKAISGGINLYASAADINNNKFYNNSSASLGAALHIFNSDNVNVHHNLIANNISSNFTGGIGMIHSTGDIYNNVIVNNEGVIASALSIRDSSNINFYKNTISNNLASTSVFYVEESHLNVNSTIVDEYISLIYMNDATADISYSCLHEEYEGIGNFVDDPLFVSPSEGNGFIYDGLNADWNLTELSLCIDAADPTLPLDEDGSVADIGALTYIFQTGFEEEEVPELVASKLNQNYPNPFNPTTTISFDLDTQKDEEVNIEIFNVKGQKIKSFRNLQTSNSSNQQIVWDGTDEIGNYVSSGLYFYRLQIDGKVIDSKKMMLIK